jgi:hypothetical protein
MDNASSVRSRSGDLGDPDGDWEVSGGVAAGLAHVSPPAVARPAGRDGASVRSSAGFSGGRFWVLRDDSDGESEASVVSDGEGGTQGSPPSARPGPCCRR